MPVKLNLMNTINTRLRDAHLGYLSNTLKQLLKQYTVKQLNTMKSLSLIRAFILILLTTTIAACGGSGGGGSGGGGSSPGDSSLDPDLGGVHSELAAFGVTNFAVTPNQESFILTWTNPTNPPEAISNYTVQAIAYGTFTSNITIVSNSVTTTFPYAGNSAVQEYNYTGLTEDNFYEFFATADYTSGNSSDRFKVFNGRLLAGLNADGNSLADAQESNDGAPDQDRDGVADAADNCPAVVNPEQINRYGGLAGDACDNSDGDAILDITDNCPFVNNTGQENNYGGALGDLCEDSDYDSVVDAQDNCPLVANLDQLNTYYGNATDLYGSGTDSEGDACDDTDGDLTVDANDIDNDNDGLIEIFDYERLNSVRNNLAGTGLDLNNTDANVLSGGFASGCGLGGCNGYELMANISLANTGNWEPIGERLRGISDVDEHFSGIFEGNGNRISDVYIEESLPPHQLRQDVLGFFNSIVEGEVRNLHIRNISISATNHFSVGGLAGFMNLGRISSVRIDIDSIVLENLNNGAPSGVGGLVGRLGVDMNTQISNLVTARLLSGANDVGGLLGFADFEAGGSLELVGNAVIIQTIAANATANPVNGNPGPSGGLIGRISGGGAVAITNPGDFVVRSSMVVAHTIESTRNTGVSSGGTSAGFTEGEIQIEASLSIVNTSISPDNAYGLGGSNPMTSYYDNSVASFFNPAGESKTTQDSSRGRPTTELQSPTTTDPRVPPANTIYSDWDAATFGRCNSDEGIIFDLFDFNSPIVWDFGTTTEYPALNCLPASPAEQREMFRRVLSGQPPVEF